MHKVNHRLVSRLAIAILLLSVTGQVSAEAKPQTFKDWGRTCETPKEGADEICYIFRTE